MRGGQPIFNLEIKKKSGLSINPDIHHSKVFSSDNFTWMIDYNVEGLMVEPVLKPSTKRTPKQKYSTLIF